MRSCGSTLAVRLRYRPHVAALSSPQRYMTRTVCDRRLRTLRHLILTVASTWILATEVHASTISVAAGGDLQAALNAAQPGDVILLQAGATFTGNFILPVKSGSSMITIRSSAADASLPGTDLRVSAADAPLLPKIVSPNSAS